LDVQRGIAEEDDHYAVLLLSLLRLALLGNGGIERRRDKEGRRGWVFLSLSSSIFSLSLSSTRLVSTVRFNSAAASVFGTATSQHAPALLSRALRSERATMGSL
jgi:hypothetical protein